MYFGCLKLEMSKVYTIRVSYVEIRILEFLESVQRWNLKNLSRGLNLPKPGLTQAPV